MRILQKTNSKILISSSIVVVLFIIVTLVLHYCFTHNFDRALNITFIVLKAAGIIFGGFWAYFTFGVERTKEKISEQALKLREQLLEHGMKEINKLITEFIDNIDKKGPQYAYPEYESKIMNENKNILKTVFLSSFLPKGIKQDIVNVLAKYEISEQKNKENKDEYKKYVVEEFNKIHGEFDNVLKKLEELIT